MIKPLLWTSIRSLRPTRIRWGRLILISVVLIYVGLLILAPLFALIVGAFQEGVAAVLSSLSNPEVLSAFLLTLKVSLIVVAIHALFGTITAWVMVRHNFPGRSFLNGLIDVPFAVSPVVVGYMLLLLFGRMGALAPLLNTLNIQVAFEFPGLVLATLFVTLPFMIRELAPTIERLDIAQEQAAASLGAHSPRIFRKITFPALRKGFLFGLTLTMARALGEFGAILVIGGGIQGRTETATIYMYRALEERQYVGAYSAALLLGLVSLVLVYGTGYLYHKKDDGATTHH